MDTQTFVLGLIAASGGLFTFLLGVITLYKDSNTKTREQKARDEKENRELDLKVQEAAITLLEPQTLRINALEKQITLYSEQAVKCQETIRLLTDQLQDKDAKLQEHKLEIDRLKKELDKLSKQVNGKKV